MRHDDRTEASADLIPLLAALEELLGDSDMQIIVDALCRLREDKFDALHVIQASGLRAGPRGFEPRDFGIPQIDRLLKRLGAEPPEAPPPAIPLHRLRAPVDRNEPRPAMQIQGHLQHAEPLVAISISHLHAQTRQRLADGTLAIAAYPNAYGGFVYVGGPSDRVPSEPELATLVEAAQSAGIIWIKFDGDAEVVPGFQIFDEPESPQNA